MSLTHHCRPCVSQEVSSSHDMVSYMCQGWCLLFLLMITMLISVLTLLLMGIARVMSFSVIETTARHEIGEYIRNHIAFRVLSSLSLSILQIVESVFKAMIGIKDMKSVVIAHTGNCCMVTCNLSSLCKFHKRNS